MWILSSAGQTYKRIRFSPSQKKQTKKSWGLTDALNLEKARFNREKPREGKENLIMLLMRFNRVLVRFKRTLVVFNKENFLVFCVWQNYWQLLIIKNYW